MHDYLICSNRSCRLVIDLQGCSKLLDIEEIGLSVCPECGAQWSDSCPFCRRPVAVTWHGHHAHCAHCQHRFHAKAA